MEHNETENNNYHLFLGKKVRVILTFPNGKTISYQGELMGVDSISIVIDDRISGNLLISTKDISQIMEVK